MTGMRRSCQRSRLGTVLGGLACPLAFACASYSPHHTARLTPPGSNEVSLAADALVVDRGLGPELLGLPEFALSRGLSDDWDAGGRVYPFGVELNAKRRLVQDGNTLVSVMPLFAVSQVTATNADTSFVDLNAGALLLNGIELGPKLVLTLGFRSQLRLGLNAVAVREDFDEQPLDAAHAEGGKHVLDALVAAADGVPELVQGGVEPGIRIEHAGFLAPLFLVIEGILQEDAPRGWLGWW